MALESAKAQTDDPPKMAQDGPKMVPRWPHDVVQTCGFLVICCMIARIDFYNISDNGSKMAL